MTDTAAPPPGPSLPPINEPGPLRIAYDYLSGNRLVARVLLLSVLTLLLKIPLGMVGGVVADRQRYEAEATANISKAWGQSQTLVGPMIVLPYKPASASWVRALTLLPERLVIDGKLLPQERRRGLFAVTVYTASLDVVAEFSTKAVRDLLAEGDWVDWPSARLTLGVSEPKSVDATLVDLDGNRVEWTPELPTPLSSLQAPLAAAELAGRNTLNVRFRITFAGSGQLSIVPLGQRTEVSMASPWPSPSFFGRYLPTAQSIDNEGFSAKWAVSSLGRGYGQLWDGVSKTDPQAQVVLNSAFGVALYNPVNAYRETDRAIKYGILFIALTFAVCLLFEQATGTRPHFAQYGMIGLSLCVFYLLLLSFSEQIGFGIAYLVSAAAVAGQAALYTGAVQRRLAAGLAFGAFLAALYGALYALLQLEDVALLAGSLLLFAMLSLAMWFTRDLHRTQPA